MTRDSVDEQLDQLLEKAHQHLEGTSERQETLNEILNDISLRQRLFERASQQQDVKERRKQRQIVTWVMQQSSKIWRDGNISEEVYQEALAQTWLWFWQKFEQYEPERGSFIKWFNNKLGFIIRDVIRENIKDTNRRHIPLEQKDAEKNELNSIENVAGKCLAPMDWVDANSLLEHIYKWLEGEHKSLGNKRMSNHPNVHCAFLIKNRLPIKDQECLQFQSGKDWEQLVYELQESGEANLSVKQVRDYYNRRCLPCLRKFLESEGYYIPKKSQSVSKIDT